MPAKLPLNWLRNFEVAARHQSFTKAAQELNISQAAVSKRIKALEQQLQHQLFNRSAHSISLTEYGQRYWHDIRDSIYQLDSVTEQLFNTQRNNHLRIRSNISYSLLALSPILARFRDEFPQFSFEVTHTVWNSDRKKQNADIEISYRPTQPAHPDWKLLHQDKLYPVVAAHLSDKEILELPLIQILGYYRQWSWWLDLAKTLTSSPQFTRQWIQLHTNSHNLQRATWRVDNSASAYSIAEQGLGIALGRSCLLNPYLEKGSLRRLDNHTEFDAPEGFHITQLNPEKRYQSQVLIDYLMQTQPPT